MNNKFSIGLYAIAAVGGLVSGLCFSRAQYYRGKRDAFIEAREMIKEEIYEPLKSELEEKEGGLIGLFLFIFA